MAVNAYEVVIDNSNNNAFFNWLPTKKITIQLPHMHFVLYVCVRGGMGGRCIFTHNF